MVDNNCVSKVCELFSERFASLIHPNHTHVTSTSRSHQCAQAEPVDMINQ